MYNEGITSSDGVPLDNLFPALIECFAVIVSGYIAGRLGLIKEDQSSGLATFVGTFSLPSIIFMSLATIDLTSVCWYFLLSILIAKAVIFFSVLLISLLVTKPVDPAKAGLYAIFCTQSNDFAIGMAIVTSVYGSTHPEFVSYLYLLAPISLVILNPIGFFLMELSKVRTRSPSSKLQVFGNALASIATNPVVLMTALGIIGNFAFNQQIPATLSTILNVFGSAFTATALFLLGLRMVGRVQSLQGSALLLTGILIAVKELALPLIAREVTSLVFRATGINSTEMSTFSFLYGTLPAAPGVFVYATTYNVEVDLIASAMVACTFISAPLMFVSAKMVSASSLPPQSLFSALEPFQFDLAIVALLSSIWLFILFFLNKNFKKLPHGVTLFLIGSQVIGCIGLIIGRFSYPYVEYGLVTYSQLSSDIWTACLALTLVILESQSQTTVYNIIPVFVIVAYGIPALLVTVFMTALKNINPIFHCYESFTYGNVEAALTIFVQLVSLLVTMGSLILQQRNRKKYRKYLIYVREASATSDTPCTETTINDACRNSASEPFQDPREEAALYSPDNIGLLGSSDNQLLPDPHSMHHLVFLVFLASSIFINLSLSVWRVISETKTAVFVEMSFLNASLTRGQSIVALFIFGWDTIPLVQPIIKRIFEECFGGCEPIYIPPWDQLPFETQQLCSQFSNNYLDKCKLAISDKKRVRLCQYRECFSGQSMVDWLLDENLVQSRAEGIDYAKCLANGRVIQHVTNSQHFTDSDALFSFTNY